MSRIGTVPIKISEGVSIDLDSKELVVKGPKGQLTHKIPRGIELEVNQDEILVKAKSKAKTTRAMHGTTRAHLANMVIGVKDGWEKKLELVGAGYRAELNGKNLKLAIGFSHPVIIEPPDGISFNVEKNVITVSGINKELVGHVSDVIRRNRPPEPYKGKGIKYQDEYIRRKAGKAAKTAGAA